MWLTRLSTELDFISNTCGLVHGDVSINNIVIVRLLPNIFSTIPPGPESEMDSEDELVVVALPDKPCTKEGLLERNLKSGGSIIDFDYSRAKDTTSARTSVSLYLLLRCHTLLKVDCL